MRRDGGVVRKTSAPDRRTHKRSCTPMPSRDDGFAVMDVSTSICDDPKFRRLARQNPELLASAFTAYVATMAESWKVGHRMSIEDAWPAFLTYSPETVAAMIEVGLLDRRGVLSSKAWRGWFEPARDRRDKSRADWRRWQADHRRSQDGVSPDTDPDKAKPSVRPPVPSYRPSSNARGAGDNGLSTPTKEEALLALSEEFKAGRLTEIEYERRRREIA